MVKISKVDNGIMIGKDVLFVMEEAEQESKNSSKHLCLMSMVGEDMPYEWRSNVIDYPGEYDIQSFSVKAWSDKHWKMNYILGVGKQHVVVVLSKWFLDKEDMPDDVDTRLFADSKLVKHWESLEYEWKYVDLSLDEMLVQETWKQGEEAVKE